MSQIGSKEILKAIKQLLKLKFLLPRRRKGLQKLPRKK